MLTSCLIHKLIKTLYIYRIRFRVYLHASKLFRGWWCLLHLHIWRWRGNDLVLYLLLLLLLLLEILLMNVHSLLIDYWRCIVIDSFDRSVPLSSWLRVRLAIEVPQTILLLYKVFKVSGTYTCIHLGHIEVTSWVDYCHLGCRCLNGAVLTYWGRCRSLVLVILKLLLMMIIQIR